METISQSEGREFEPHWGSTRISFCQFSQNGLETFSGVASGGANG